jgi:hypothetical protein
MPTPSPQRGDRRSLRTKCVLWHAPGAAVPPNLGASLTARPVDVLTCDDPYTALASVCTAVREEPTRPTLLVLIEPGMLPMAARVLVLAEQFVPHAARWAYETASEVKLRAVTAHLLANLQRTGPVPLPAVVTARPATASPVTAGAQNGKHGEMGTSIPAIRDFRAQKLPGLSLKDDPSPGIGLTPEELAMLLADARPESVTAPSAPPSTTPGPGAPR